MSTVCLNISRRVISAILAVTFMVTSIVTPAQARLITNLPAPGVVLALTSAFTPTLVRGLEIHPTNPFQFDFIIDSGDSDLNDEEFRSESDKLIKYFLAALTTPEEEMWVNLSPDEPDRIIPKTFGQTEMGRDLLAQDYLLKQLTASLMAPDTDLGDRFWKEIKNRESSDEQRTTINDIMSKVWIVPEKAVVYEHENSVFVVDSYLKVMLESEYLDMSRAPGSEIWDPENDRTTDHGERTTTSQSIRELIIPEIEQEVNEGETFANLRQIFNSMILATWYKRRLKQSILGQTFADQNKTDGINLNDPQQNQKIYQQYLEAFKVGVANYIKEEYDPLTQQIIPKKYFTGGASAEKIDQALIAIDASSINQEQFVRVNQAVAKLRFPRRVTSQINPVGVDFQGFDRAMTVNQHEGRQMIRSIRDVSPGDFVYHQFKDEVGEVGVPDQNSLMVPITFPSSGEAYISANDFESGLILTADPSGVPEFSTFSDSDKSILRVGQRLHKGGLLNEEELNRLIEALEINARAEESYLRVVKVDELYDFVMESSLSDAKTISFIKDMTEAVFEREKGVVSFETMTHIEYQILNYMLNLFSKSYRTPNRNTATSSLTTAHQIKNLKDKLTWDRVDEQELASKVENWLVTSYARYFKRMDRDTRRTLFKEHYPHAFSILKQEFTQGEDGAMVANEDESLRINSILEVKAGDVIYDSSRDELGTIAELGEIPETSIIVNFEHSGEFTLTTFSFESGYIYRGSAGAISEFLEFEEEEQVLLKKVKALKEGKKISSKVFDRFLSAFTTHSKWEEALQLVVYQDLEKEILKSKRSPKIDVIEEFSEAVSQREKGVIDFKTINNIEFRLLDQLGRYYLRKAGAHPRKQLMLRHILVREIKVHVRSLEQEVKNNEVHSDVKRKMEAWIEKAEGSFLKKMERPQKKQLFDRHFDHAVTIFEQIIGDSAMAGETWTDQPGREVMLEDIQNLLEGIEEFKKKSDDFLAEAEERGKNKYTESIKFSTEESNLKRLGDVLQDFESSLKSKNKIIFKTIKSSV